MTELGLLSLFTPGTVVALVVLSVGMLLGLHWNVAEWLLGAAPGHLSRADPRHPGRAVRHAAVLLVLQARRHRGLHPAHGEVDPTIQVGGIYHNWPGFFAGSALLTAAAGSPDALRIATWAPLAFNLINLVVLRYLFRGLTRNTRLVWLGCGSSSSSPGSARTTSLRRPWRTRSTWPASACWSGARSPGSMLAAFVLVVSVVAASHQITPMMLFIAVAALVRAAAYPRLVPPADRRGRQPQPGGCSPRAATPSRGSGS